MEGRGRRMGNNEVGEERKGNMKMGEGGRMIDNKMSPLKKKRGETIFWRKASLCLFILRLKEKIFRI